MARGTQLLENVHFTETKVDVSAAARNQRLLDGYVGLRALSPASVEGYTSALASFTRHAEAPLEEAGELDVAAWFRGARAQLRASTIIVYAVYLEELIRFSLRGRGLGKKVAKERAAAIMEGVPILDLRREVRRHCEFREMLILREEEAALWEAAAWPRAKAYMAVSRDTACRKGELISARVMDLTHHDGYSVLRVLGKTGERTMPLVRSVPVLMDWLEAHPRPTPGAPLFATVWRGEVRFMDEYAPNKLMWRLCLRAGLRQINPHMWRHTRLTEWARAGVGEYTLKSLAGWTPDSKMAARYIHLSGRDHVRTVPSREGGTGSLAYYTRRALDTAMLLMASEDRETKLFALRTFMQLNGQGRMQTTLDRGGMFQEAVK